MEYLHFNKYQSSLEDLNIDSYPQEVQDEFFEAINGIPIVRNLISPNRPYCKDLPRDAEGKAIIDITNPPIIEDTDYFRPTAIYYKKHGVLTNLKPNSNPNSEFGKWIREEIKRIWNGYVRESDGAWITGDMYWYLNYCPIVQSKIRKGTKIADRIVDMPEFWEGIWLRFMYIHESRLNAEHSAEIAKRGASKSYSVAAILSKCFVVGDNEETKENVRAMVTAYQKEYLVKDGTLNKFVEMVDFQAQHTQFPSKRLRSSLQDMQWKMGYVDLDSGAQRGTLNEVIGVSSKDDPDKLRGKRSTKIIIEEFGNFPKVVDTYRVILPSVQEGDIVFGQMILIGTGGSEGADFAGAQEIIYNPKGYNIHPIKNVYDKTSQGKGECIFFFGAYLNRKGCYNEDGISDVTKAILELCYNRYIVKYNTTDPMALTRTKAENPLTLQEAIMRRDGSIFPVSSLLDRIGEIDSNPSEYDDVYIGNLEFDKSGEINFIPTTKQPIRNFPHKDNKLEGCVEIFQLPEKDRNGKVFSSRYILGADPYDDDTSETLSLGSIFVLDLWTDKIVAEYTGRPTFAEDFFEICRKLCLFYNGRLNYEAHPYNQIVRLPNGETKLWKDIKIGDCLFSKDGKVVKVIDIPMDGEDDIYRITLDDGRTVEASSNHIWSVYKMPNRYNLVNITTKDIYEYGLKNKYNQKNFFLPDSGLVEYPHKDVPIDPYTLGLLIAEGALTKFKKDKYKNFTRNSVQFSSSVKDCQFYKTVIPYNIKYIGNKGYSWHIYIEDIDKKLESLQLLHKDSKIKFIPDLYLYNDSSTRLELLKGLMDGDGCAVKNGASVYITTSKQLSEDIKLLCRSLGIKCKNNKGRKAQEVYFSNSGNTYNCSEVYRVSICAEFPIFKLPRKVNKQHIYDPKAPGSKDQGFLNRSGIVDIEYIGRKKCKCVTVDSSDGLYLVGDYIVTHNCNKKGLFAYFSKMNCLYLLTDVLEYLRDKEMIKGNLIGNKSKGTNATLPINNYARTLIRNWLILPKIKIINDGQEDKEITILNLNFIRNRALLQELSQWNSDGNFDRVSALGMLMLLREEKMILYQGDMSKVNEKVSSDYLGNDPYFTNNFRQ